MKQSVFWNNHKKIYRACWIFFFSLNTIPLLFVSTAYSHRSRVESMVYLSKKKDFQNLIVDESFHDSYKLPPQFYLKHWLRHTLYLTQTFTTDSLAARLKDITPDPQPNYVVFARNDKLEERIENFTKLFPHLEFETTIEPGLVDKVMHRLNPNNENYTTYIYRIE